MKRNYGISILRVLLAFGVVGGHFSRVGVPFNILAPVAVPCFMTLAFIFFSRHLEVKSAGYLKSRIERLLVPYIVWPVIYLFAYSAVYTILNINFLPEFVDWKSSFFFQLLFGHSIITVLWFHWCLILLTVIVYYISYLPKYLLIVLAAVVVVLSLFLQYSGLNNVFADMRFELRYPLGRFIEMVPYCVIGCILGTLKKDDNEESVIKNLIITICALVFFCLLYIPSEIHLKANFDYAGILLILKSITLIAVFWFLPINGLIQKHPKLMAFVDKATKYTMGVYCLHFLVGNFVARVIDFDIIKCIIIYVVCYVISWCMELINNKFFNKQWINNLYN